MKLEGLDWSSLSLQCTSAEPTLPSIQIGTRRDGESNRRFRVTLGSPSDASHILNLVNWSASASEQKKW